MEITCCSLLLMIDGFFIVKARFSQKMGMSWELLWSILAPNLRIIAMWIPRDLGLFFSNSAHAGSLKDDGESCSSG